MRDDASEFSAEFERLAARYLRIAQYGDGEADVAAASAFAGDLVCRATAAGHFPIEMPPIESANRPSADQHAPYVLRWEAAISAYRYAYPTIFTQPNPACVHWEHRSSTGAEHVGVGRMKRADWRIRAENYATVCEGFAKLLGDGEIDGPVEGFRWRHRGVVTAGRLQAAAWRMVNQLWGSADHAASFDDLKLPVYSDAEHIADLNAFGSLRRAANKYFQDHGIPWKVSIASGVVTLTAAE